MENNKLDSSHIELKVFVGHSSGDVPWTLGHEDLKLIRLKISSV